MAFLLKNFFESFLVLLISYYVSIVLGYFIIRRWLREWFLRVLKDDYRWKLVQDSVRENPKTTSFMVWSVLMPETIKMAVLGLAGLNLYEYLMPSIPMFVLQSALYSLIGTSLHSMNEELGNKSWKD